MLTKRLTGVLTVPGDPQDVKVQSINSTAIHVQWKPPLEKERNGIIRGYHIHVQETKEEVTELDIVTQTRVKIWDSD